MDIFRRDEDYCSSCSAVENMSIAEFADKKIREIERRAKEKKLFAHHKEIDEAYKQLRATELKILQLEGFIAKITTK